MRHPICLLLGVFFAICSLACCSSNARADRAAERYYEYLMDGKSKKFVNGIAYRDSMTKEYYRQMVVLMEKHVEKEKKTHGKITGIKATRNDATSGETTVFLTITYADATSEKIAVPMVKCGDEWKMQ